MVSFHTFLAAVIFIPSHSALAVAAPSFPEPVIFSGLTLAEFLQKRAEHHGKLAKREYVGEEIQNKANNNHAGQTLIESLSKECVEKWKEGAWRAFRGGCSKTRNKQHDALDWYCQVPPSTSHSGRHHMSKTCWAEQTWELIDAVNYLGKVRSFPYCKDNFKIDKRPGPEVEIPARYEGWLNLPPEQNEDWPMDHDFPSPGTVDFFYEVTGVVKNLKAAWEYRGHWSNGWGFLLASAGLVSSFSCLGCPKGTLYAETVGFKTTASGFVF